MLNQFEIRAPCFEPLSHLIYVYCVWFLHILYVAIFFDYSNNTKYVFTYEREKFHRHSTTRLSRQSALKRFMLISIRFLLDIAFISHKREKTLCSILPELVVCSQLEAFIWFCVLFSLEKRFISEAHDNYEVHQRR